MSTLLVLCFFPAFNPPASGGELRLLNLYKAVSRDHSVTLLTSTDFGVRQEEILHTPTFREIRFPKDELWRTAYATLGRAEIEGELSGLAFALAVSDPRCRLRQAARAMAADVDLVIHEFPFSEPIFADGAFADKEIYNAHNFELSLLGSIARGTGFEHAFLKLMRMEANLVARARTVFATGPADAAKFRLFYGLDRPKIQICPSGYDPEELATVAGLRAPSAEDEAARPKLLFFGSGHEPNVEAARALIGMAPALEGCDVLIAGGVGKAINAKSLPRNVVMLGQFDQRAKLKLLADADLFVNPVVLGSGTSLKVLEALGAGLPLLSTPEGARGLDLVDGVHARIVPRAKFPETVRALIDDPGARHGLATAGHALARKRFTWDTIGQAFGETVTRPASPGPALRRRSEAARPLVLAFNDYPVLDTDSGGKSRVFNLLDSLDVSVVLVSFGASADVVLLGSEFIHVTVPKTAEHRAFERAANQGQPLSVNDCVAALFAASNRMLADIAAALASRAAACVFEHPYMAPILDVVAGVSPDMPVVYSAHNVEATHRVKMLDEHTSGPALSAFVTDLEALLVRRADLVVACTDADVRDFASQNADTVLAPNGCALPTRDTLEEARLSARPRRTRLGFMGSGHGPNVEAATFVIRELAPAFPSVEFQFVGGVCAALGRSAPRNVVLLGLVDESDKTWTLATWTLALNPVATGGGSSLKLPDFLAHGLPTISTPTGARGFEVAERGAGIVVERPGFRAAIETALADPAGLREQSANAHRYASEALSWKVCARPYGERLRRLIQGRRVRDRKDDRSLLVVTYRYTEPSAGGAEEYLIEVLKHLRRKYARIDLAVVDVGDIGNVHHFATRLSGGGIGAAGRIAELFDQALFFPADEPAADDVARRCRNLERQWTQGQFELHLPFAAEFSREGKLRLFSGFFGAEEHGGIVRRWTSPAFSLLLPPATRVLRVRGLTEGTKNVALTLIRVTADSVPEIVDERSVAVDRRFDVALALPAVSGGAAVIMHFDVDEHAAGGDHRPLGLWIEEASALVGSNEHAAGEAISALRYSAADLTENLEDTLRSDHFDAWIEALREGAQRNAASAEADFAAVRGPHSAKMQAWLAANGGAYDVALVQGIPFDVVPSTVATLKALPRRPRIVTLPHFHGDDRFYHWRRYRESFEQADTTLLFSSSIARHMNLPGKIALVSGGGVRPDEQADLGARAAFAEVHPDRTPFFLVVGRKTGSKGYDRVLRVHADLRKDGGYAADLVLIGPDEDRLPVTEEGVRYLGRQPRPVVRGALSSCLGLITMSMSESFGIVLCEAWLFGKPVIANRVCYAFRELVTDGETGVLVGNDEDLKEAMRQLAGDAPARHAMGQRGYDLVTSRFSWARVAEDIHASLEADAVRGFN